MPSRSSEPLPHQLPPAANPRDQAAPPDERDLLHFLLGNIPDRIYFKDLESRFVRISRALAELFGLTDPSEAIGKTDFDFFTPEHAEPALRDEQEIIRTGNPMTGKVEKETLPDGRADWVLTTKMPLRDRSGRIIGTCGISKDITAFKEMDDALHQSNTDLARTLSELKTVQQQLLAAERIQSIGRLAAGVAHEVRNPLNILSAGLDYLASEPAVTADSGVAEILKEMHEAIRRADAVICALMENSDQTSLVLAEADILAAIENALAHFSEEIASAQIKVQRDLGPDVPRLRLDRDKIEQAFGAIFLNAIQAMPSGGCLSVRTEVKKLAREEIEWDAGIRSGERLHVGDEVVLIEVLDTGSGITPGAMQKIFDPFFTTKETGKGAGLGLTICQKIIELHRGAIEVSNRPEGGTRIRVILKTGR